VNRNAAEGVPYGGIMRLFEAAEGDITASLQSVLDQGPGMVRLGPGEYLCARLRIPAGVMLVGEGTATVLRLGDGKVIIHQQEVGNWALRDLVLAGNSDGDWTERTDLGERGIDISGCWGYDISGVTAKHFNGAGIRVAHTPLFTGQAPFCNGGNLDRVTVHGCHAGLLFDTRGEYLNAVALSAYRNITGVVIHAGNVKLTGGNICSNLDGVYIEDHENGSHGALGNCLINHNQRHALWCRNVKNGMTVENCCLFYGDITLEDCRGIVISGGEICCNLFTRGAGVNRIAGNYIIPYPGICERFEFTLGTSIESNFTAEGSWNARP